MSFTFSFHSNIIHKSKIALFNCGGSLSNDLTHKKDIFANQCSTSTLKRDLCHSTITAN